MDNEPGRKWTACQYAEECVKFAREMRLADPDIELMMAAYTYSPDLLPDMLEIAGKDIQYVIYRQGDPICPQNPSRYQEYTGKRYGPKAGQHGMAALLP